MKLISLIAFTLRKNKNYLQPAYLRLGKGCPHIVYEGGQVLLTVGHHQEHTVQATAHHNLQQLHYVVMAQLLQYGYLSHTADGKTWTPR